jgi:triacylglycerol lipase
MKYPTRIAGLMLLCLAPMVPAVGADLPGARSVDLFGQRIAYYDVGAGPTVVLLHGLGSSARGDWGACMSRLAAHHRVLAPDLLGFGASAKPVIDYGIQTWVDFLGEFLRVEQVGRFSLAGESLGGWIAARYTVEALGPRKAEATAASLPRPDRLILVDAAGHRRLAEAMLNGDRPGLSLAGSKGLLAAVFHDPALHSDEAARAKFAASLSSGDGWTIHSIFSNRAILGECVDDQLASITVPTLVVWGADDRLVPLEDGRDFAARIPGAKLVIIPDSGHAPVIEKPAAVCDALEPFLAGR